MLFDDRPDSAGVKFNDADLIGLPLRATISPRGLKNGQVELKRRAGGEVEFVALETAADEIAARLAALRREATELGG